MKKLLLLTFIITPLLFPAKSSAAGPAQRYRNGFRYTQPYYGGLNGNGSYYSEGGTSYRGFTYSYPQRPYQVFTPYGGFQSYPRRSQYQNRYSHYSRSPYPQYNTEYPGFIYPW